jgi:ribosomal protein L7/L12
MVALRSGELTIRRIWGAYMAEQIDVVVVLILGLFAIIAALSARLSVIERRLTRLSAVEAKQDFLLKHFGLQYEPYKNLPNTVVDALRSGEKIEAIKCYREATGITLKEAKDFIEEVLRRGG